MTEEVSQVSFTQALHFYHASKRCLPLETSILSQGLFVERVVRMVQSGALAAARTALKNFQDVLLDNETKTAAQLSIADPHPLIWWIRKQLVRKE